MKTNYKINLIQDRAIINILGEVCWGFKVNDFEKIIGASYETVETLLKRLVNEEKAGVIETYLTDYEVEFIKKALVVVEKEIEEWEFAIRFGVNLEEVKEISIFK